MKRLLLLLLVQPAFAQEMTLETVNLINVQPGIFSNTFTSDSAVSPITPVYSVNGLLGPSATSSNWGLNGLNMWTPAFIAEFGLDGNSALPSDGCSHGCTGSPGLADGTYLEANFATPVDSVSVTEVSSGIAGFVAFDSAGNQVGGCSESGGGVCTLNANAISYILATSYDYTPAEISAVTYSAQQVPEPGTFLMMFLGLIGLGCYKRR